jgi:hypothetical protein
MPIGPTGLQDARLGINLPLTNLAQGFTQPSAVMKLLFPLADVASYGGQIIQFDDSVYDDVDDNRDDDTPYPEIQSSYSGRPYQLITKGLSYRVPDKRRKEMENLGLNWGEIAKNAVMGKFALRHEIEAASVATTAANYIAGGTVADPTLGTTLTGGAGSYFTDAAINPINVVRRAKTSVAMRTGVDPNVAIMGRDVFDGLAARYANAFTSSFDPRATLTEEMLANLFGLARVAVCDALVRTNTAQALNRVFGKHMVLGYTNPKALEADRLPYRPIGSITPMEMAYGYTLVMDGNPLMYDPYYDNERGATVYKGDFDRRVVNPSVDGSSKITAGYLLQNMVA